MNVKGYIKEAEQQLIKVNNCLKLQEDSTKISIILDGNTTERLKKRKSTTETFLESLEKNDPKTLKFPLQLKKNNRGPGRPIELSGISK